MKQKKFKELAVPNKYADDPLEEGFRILARIILREILRERAIVPKSTTEQPV